MYAIAGLDDEINGAAPNTATSGTVRFLLFTNALIGRTIEVSFASVGLSEPVVVRDLRLQQDLGTFTNSFHRMLNAHASGLFKFTPVTGRAAAIDR